MYFCPVPEACECACMGMRYRTSMARRAGEHPKGIVVSGVRGGATGNNRTDDRASAVSRRAVSVRVLRQYWDEIGLAVRRGPPVAGHAASSEERALVPVLCARVSSNLGCLATDGVTARWPVSFESLCQFVASPGMEMRPGPRVACGASLDSRGTLVPVLRAEPEAETRRNARDCKRTGRAMSVDTLQKWSHASLVVLQIRTRLESMCSQHQERPPKKGELVPGMLQPAAAIPWETQPSCDARSGDFAGWQVFIRRIPGQQDQTTLGMRAGTPLAGGAFLCDPGLLVSGMRQESAADVAAISGDSCKPRGDLSVRNLYQRADSILVALRRRT